MTDAFPIIHPQKLRPEDVPAHSPFVERALRAAAPGDEAKRAEVLGRLASTVWTREALEAALSGLTDTTALGMKLRMIRRELVAGLAVRDASGLGDYEEVVRVMSDFAEVSVDAMVRAHTRELAARHGVPCDPEGNPMDLMVVGMGKLGGRELNVSSDIDLIFLYWTEGETRVTPDTPDARRTLTAQEFFERLARRVINGLNDVEGPGFVFRVDMRLRPNGDSGPIVCSTDMLEEYLYAQGRDWERFAWLKGRICNRAVYETPAAFEQHALGVRALVRPFVFRKYLDFGAISSLTKLHELVRAETDRRELARGAEGVNVKLGRGGIREIEFIAQTLQVIRGGRDATLRGRETLLMLDALARAGAMPEERAAKLKEAYVFLRNVEHALQYVDDQQTQFLPRTGETAERAARLLGVTLEDLWTQVEAVRGFVAQAFEGVFLLKDEKAESAGDDWPVGWQTGTRTAREALAAKLRSLGYGEDLDEVIERVTALATGRRGAMGEEARSRMTKLLPFVMEKAPGWCGAGAGRVIAPEEALGRYLKLLEAVSGRSTYVAMLHQYPRAAERVGRILAASRWSTDFVVRHPIILDELVDGRIREMSDDSPVDRSAWRAELRAALAQAEGDVERLMNVLRDAHHAALFRLLVADLDGRFTVMRLADQLSALADAVIAEVLELAWANLTKRHAERPTFAVIGYGKLGGKELGYESDLDLVFIHDDPAQEADAVYARLVRKMLSWLTLQTSSGKLFEVDMRLRPNGENGLITTNFAQFSRYERNEDGHGAWLWEHQALTRARFVAGDDALGAKFEAEREFVLRTPRDRETVLSGVAEMRRKMRDGHPNRTARFDIKHDAGGMVDVEFAVQALVLMHAHEHPSMVLNLGNIQLLELSGALGLIPEATAEAAADAYRKLRVIQHEVRLNAGEGVPARVEPERVETERRAVEALWRAVFGEPWRKD